MKRHAEDESEQHPPKASALDASEFDAATLMSLLVDEIAPFLLRAHDAVTWVNLSQANKFLFTTLPRAWSMVSQMDCWPCEPCNRAAFALARAAFFQAPRETCASIVASICRVMDAGAGIAHCIARDVYSIQEPERSQHMDTLLKTRLMGLDYHVSCAIRSHRPDIAVRWFLLADDTGIHRLFDHVPEHIPFSLAREVILRLMNPGIRVHVVRPVTFRSFYERGPARLSDGDFEWMLEHVFCLPSTYHIPDILRLPLDWPRFARFVAMLPCVCSNHYAKEIGVEIALHSWRLPVELRAARAWILSLLSDDQLRDVLEKLRKECGDGDRAVAEIKFMRETGIAVPDALLLRAGWKMTDPRWVDVATGDELNSDEALVALANGLLPGATYFRGRDLGATAERIRSFVRAMAKAMDEGAEGV